MDLNTRAKDLFKGVDFWLECNFQANPLIIQVQGS